MTIKYYPEIKARGFTANIVNYNDLNLKELNLEPFYADLFPIYFNSFGDLAYTFSSSHHNTQIETYIGNAVQTFEYKKEERFVVGNNSATFAVVNNKVYFISQITDLMPYLKDEIEAFLGSTLEFIPAPEVRNITEYRNYEASILSIPEAIPFCIDLSITESLLIESKRFYFPKKAEELTFFDVADATNYRANFFNSDRFNWNDSEKILGVYNQEALKMLNSIYSTRASIYKTFYEAFIAVEDPKKLIKAFRKHFNPVVFEDIMIKFFGFDKIDSLQRNRNLSPLYVENPEYFWDSSHLNTSININTSKRNPFELFFNYLITGDFEVKLYNQMEFCKSSGDLIEIDRNNFFESGLEKDFQREIALIRRLVPKEDIDKYML